MEESLRRVVNAIPGLVWSADPSGSFDFLNQPWCQYTGLSLAAARGDGWQAAIHPEDLPDLLAQFRHWLSTERAGEIEARLKRHDGHYRWFLFRAVPLHEQSGRLVKWFGQQFDIDDRKRAEALLAGEKRLLEMVACGSALPIVLDALCTLFEETAPGCHCSVLLPDESGAAPTLPESFGQAIDGKQSSCWTTPILAFDDTVLGTFALYRRTPGLPSAQHLHLIERFSHLASIAIERARHEAALGRAEAFLSEGERLGSTGSFRWRLGGDELTWSEQTYRIYGLPPGTRVTFALVNTRLHPDDKPLFEDMRGRARDGEEIAFEHRIVMPDESVKHLQIVAHARPDPVGGIEYYGAVRDVTELRRSEDALNRVRSELAHVARVATLGALTASIAHEVNQPLSGIVTNASTSLRLLGDVPPNIEAARETARRTIRDAHRASEVIARLRTLFSKNGHALEPVDLNAATREVLALMRSDLQRARVRVLLSLDPSLPLVRGDRVQLQQVVLNLVRNGFEAMSELDEPARVLSVRTEAEAGARVRLTVQDNGPGFDAATADRMFEAFYTTKREGMGMGLSISRSIIESLHGKLWASTGPDSGASFAFSIPCATRQAEG